ncbi:MAG: hypothetical protein VKL20_00235 [Synechocystis sp.]|nr:hypothetical protein [Synechocystis sp.]
MPWLKSIPLVSIALVIITYAAFGWSTASASVIWTEQWHEQLQALEWNVEEQTILLFIHGFALLAITLITLALTAPITLMTYFVGSWVQSEARSMVSMVLWSFLFVIALRWFNHFTTFLVLLCAAILGRIELRYVGLNQTHTLLLLTVICLAGFSGGAYAYFYYNSFPFSSH